MKLGHQLQEPLLRNIPIPDQLPEAIEDIGTASIGKLESALNRLLDQRDRAREAKEKSLRVRLKVLFFTLLWILVGILLDKLVGLLFPSH
jgi:hypothetical protein